MSKCITFTRFLRAVESEAARWGYRGDALAKDVPLVGNVQQQFDQAAIYVDVRPRPENDRERKLLKRLIRAAVLTSPPRRPEPVDTSIAATMAREWRRRGR
jgi:hypothetical protein